MRDYVASSLQNTIEHDQYDLYAVVVSNQIINFHISLTNIIRIILVD
jgi:hypothetical protein